MTCWQAHLTGQINTDNLFADSTVLSQHWSTPKRWFPFRKALTLLLKRSASRNPLCAIPSGFWESAEARDSTCWKHRRKVLLQNGTMWCVNNLNDALMGRLKGNIVQVAELWSTVISTHLKLLFVLHSLPLIFFSLKCSPFAPTHLLSSTGPVPSPVFPPPLTQDLRFPCPIF